MTIIGTPQTNEIIYGSALQYFTLKMTAQITFWLGRIFSFCTFSAFLF